VTGSATVAIVGAAETAEIGTVMQSSLGLAAAAARRALADCGLTPADVDGVAISGLNPYLPTLLSHSLGIEPRWVDATMVGGCSNVVHLRHAVAAIRDGQCEVALIAHGESGRSHIGGAAFIHSPDSWPGQFELPFGTAGPMTLLTLGALRFLRDRGLDRRALAEVVVAQRSWAAHNPRAVRRDPITVAEVLDAPLVAYPFTRPMCCVTTDAGGALVVMSAERARDLPHSPVYVLGAGEATGAAMASQMRDLTSSDAFRRAGAAAFSQSGLTPSDINHAMLYDATAILPLMALEDLGFVSRGDSGEFVAEGNTAVGGRLPVNTNGGGLNYTHSGMYGMYALQESVRQLRGDAAAQVAGIGTSLTHAIGGMFQAAATAILSTEAA
jgi:acetyl-CoA acetyltransferase